MEYFQIIIYIFPCENVKMAETLQIQAKRRLNRFLFTPQGIDVAAKTKNKFILSE